MAGPSPSQIQAVHERLDGSGCPLCGQDVWDFDEMHVVVLVDPEMPATLRQRSQLHGAREPEMGLAVRIFEEAARDSRLIKIACNNCGHTELLDTGKLGG